MKATMPCKMGTKKLSKTASETTESNKTKHASIVDTHERESVWDPLHQEIMKIITQRKGAIQ